MMDSSPLAADGASSNRQNAGAATTTAKVNGNGKAGGNGKQPGAPLLPPDSPLLRDLNVTLQARLGEAVMPIAELLALRAGSVLSLETRLNEPVELYLNDALVGRGEIVAVDDRFGVRILEIAAA
jgi:flagellar motor switch protein FliN/FliY